MASQGLIIIHPTKYVLGYIVWSKTFCLFILCLYLSTLAHSFVFPYHKVKVFVLKSYKNLYYEDCWISFVLVLMYGNSKSLAVRMKSNEDSSFYKFLYDFNIKPFSYGMERCHVKCLLINI